MVRLDKSRTVPTDSIPIIHVGNDPVGSTVSPVVADVEIVERARTNGVLLVRRERFAEILPTVNVPVEIRVLREGIGQSSESLSHAELTSARSTINSNSVVLRKQSCL